MRGSRPRLPSRPLSSKASERAAAAAPGRSPSSAVATRRRPATVRPIILALVSGVPSILAMRSRRTKLSGAVCCSALCGSHPQARQQLLLERAGVHVARPPLRRVEDSRQEVLRGPDAGDLELAERAEHPGRRVVAVTVPYD